MTPKDQVARSRGNDRTRIGWFRDARCIAPQWPVRKVSGMEVALRGQPGTWKVELVETMTAKVLETRQIRTEKEQLRISLPAFEGSIALRLTKSL